MTPGHLDNPVRHVGLARDVWTPDEARAMWNDPDAVDHAMDEHEEHFRACLPLWKLEGAPLFPIVHPAVVWADLRSSRTRPSWVGNLPLGRGDNQARVQFFRRVTALISLIDHLLGQQGGTACMTTYFTTLPPTWWPSALVQFVLSTISGARCDRRTLEPWGVHLGYVT